MATEQEKYSFDMSAEQNRIDLARANTPEARLAEATNSQLWYGERPPKQVSPQEARYNTTSGNMVSPIVMSKGGAYNFSTPISYNPPPAPSVPVPVMPTFTAPEMGEMPTFTAPERPEFKLDLPEYKRPTFEAPVMGSMPTFAAPTYDEGKVSSLTQKHAAAGTRKLRSAVQEAMTKRSDNPNINRMTLRDALAGYGEGLEDVMSGAAKTATAEYAQQYAYKYQEAGMNYNTAVQTVRDKYAGDMTAKKADFDAEIQAVNTVYQAEYNKELARVQNEAQQYAYEFQAAGMNYSTAVQKVRDEFQGKMDSKKMEFQAAINAVNLAYQGQMNTAQMTYQGEVEKERFRVDEERRTQSFDYMYDEFKKSSLAGGSSKTGFTGGTYGNTIDNFGNRLV